MEPENFFSEPASIASSLAEGVNSFVGAPLLSPTGTERALKGVEEGVKDS